MTVNEVRALDGLKPVKGGDVILSLQKLTPDLGLQEIEKRFTKIMGVVRNVNRRYSNVLKVLETAKGKEEARKVVIEGLLQSQVVRESWVIQAVVSVLKT